MEKKMATSIIGYTGLGFRVFLPGYYVFEIYRDNGKGNGNRYLGFRILV